MPDKRFVDSYNKITLDPEASARIRARLEQELLPGKEKDPSMKTKKTLRITLIAAVISILFIITLIAAVISILFITSAYAISGIVRGTVTHLMKDTGTFDTLDALPRAEKIAGYPITAPARFSNGYEFKTLNVGGEAAYGDDNEILKEYYTVYIEYERDEKQDLSLTLSPVLELPTERKGQEPNETKEIDGIEVRFSRDHFKFVPPDYEKTEEDLAAEETGHYYVSFGSDEIMEYDYSFALFTLGNVEYTLFDQSGRNDTAELCELAAEVIKAYQGR